MVAGVSVALLFDELELEIDSLLLTNSVVETDSLLLADSEIAEA
ncbi:hypothetical protein C120C_0246 [Leuconostoc inhae]|nr:hypothetical protein PB1E_1596 [Leuconostoc gasicomitatum]CUW12100.1 hypothetical protein C120C_0246 [Leuconostoc inhae]